MGDRARHGHIGVIAQRPSFAFAHVPASQQTFTTFAVPPQLAAHFPPSQSIPAPPQLVPMHATLASPALARTPPLQEVEPAQTTSAVWCDVTVTGPP